MFKNKIKECLKLAKDVRADWIGVARFSLSWVPFAIATGIAIGLCASLFDWLLTIINRFVAASMVSTLAFSLFAAAITGILINKDESIAGAGINYVLGHLFSSKLNIAQFIGKFTASILALSGSFIAGREGPSFFLGASIAHFVSKYFNIEKKFTDYIALVGAGAFTGALLKAPLGGALFALEVRYLMDMDYKPFPQTIVASSVSFFIFSLFRGHSSFISLSTKPIWHPKILPALIALGVLIAVLTYIYINIFHFASCLSAHLKSSIRPLAGVVLAIPILIVLLHIDNYQILSVSVNYHALNRILQNQIGITDSIVHILFIVSLVSLTIGFGISGGLVLPSLFIGALAGNIFGTVFADTLTFTLAGMAAMLASTAKTPIAAIVIVLEMSGTDIVIPITASVVVSYILTYGKNIYGAQQIKR